MILVRNADCLSSHHTGYIPLPEQIKKHLACISLDELAATMAAYPFACHGFLMTSLYFWPQNHFFNAQGIATKLTDCFRQAVDFLIIRVSLIPDKSIGQVWRGRKPLLEQSPNHSDHQMDLHEVKWYDSLGHGDLKNWLVPRGSGTQVGKLQIRSRNCGFFMQDLGLKKKKKHKLLTGIVYAHIERIQWTEPSRAQKIRHSRALFTDSIWAVILSIDYKQFCCQPNVLL